MAAEAFEVPVPICEVCWLIDHTIWEPESVTEDGKIVMRLTGVDVPEKHNTNSVEICAECGSITISGIYELRNPSTLLYLNDMDNESDSEFYDPTAFIYDLSDTEHQDNGDEYE